MEQQKNLLSAFQNSLWNKTLAREIKLMYSNCYQLPLIISHCELLGTFKYQLE